MGRLHSGGSASPKGEARREAPARRSKANAAPGRITGGGGRGGASKPYHATHPTPPPPKHPRQREPEGRSPARSAGKAEQSECRAREDYGWGWAGRCQASRTTQPTQHPPSQTPAAARARRAKPGAKRRQGRAKRMPRQGGLRVGVGGAVQASRTTQPTQHPRPPNTRGSASPKGEARREAPARQSKANAAPGRITGGGGRAV